MPNRYQRTYTPGPQDARLCAGCGAYCLPWPDRDSQRCSWCWWVAQQKHR